MPQAANEVRVYNNGDGVPVEVHKEEGVYVPELIFGHLLTSSNYNDEEKKVRGTKPAFLHCPDSVRHKGDNDVPEGIQGPKDNAPYMLAKFTRALPALFFVCSYHQEPAYRNRPQSPLRRNTTIH